MIKTEKLCKKLANTQRKKRRLMLKIGRIKDKLGVYGGINEIPNLNELCIKVEDEQTEKIHVSFTKSEWKEIQNKLEDVNGEYDIYSEFGLESTELRNKFITAYIEDKK